MTGPARHSATGNDTMTAPYAVPKVVASPAASPRVGSAPALFPFVPPAHRHASAPRAAEILERGNAYDTPLAMPDWVRANETELASNGTDLPWIDAYADDVQANSDDAAQVAEAHGNQASSETRSPTDSAPEDSWMLGDAGGRLDDLKRSMASLDAAQLAAHPPAGSEPGNAHAAGSRADSDGAHRMWSEDEWMDIMPSPASASEQPAQGLPASDTTPATAQALPASSAAPATAQALPASSTAPATAQVAHARSAQEASAQALEAVARRIRQGHVSVPAYQPDLGDAALLAGILASLLGHQR